MTYTPVFESHNTNEMNGNELLNKVQNKKEKTKFLSCLPKKEIARIKEKDTLLEEKKKEGLRWEGKNTKSTLFYSYT